MTSTEAPAALRDVRGCFEGLVPAVIATSSASGVPNVTYLSRVCLVDDDHVALSNQFFSKTARNLAENPRASMLLIDPVTYDEFRITLVYERTDRRGPVFEHLRREVDAIAAITGMQAVFRLRGADVYRVDAVERVPATGAAQGPRRADGRSPAPAPRADVAGVAELCRRLGRCPDLDTLVAAAVEGLDTVLHYEHAVLLLLDEEGTHLYTIASHGYPTEAVGSEVPVGAGIIGLAAARCAPVRVGNLRMIGKYGRTVRRTFGDAGIGPGHEVALPDLEGVESRLAVPAVARGAVVGVLVVESGEPAAFDEDDEAVLTAVASLVASAVEAMRAQERDDATRLPQQPAPTPPGTPTTRVRFYAVDGSTFFDGDYVIKGVAGRILWSLLSAHDVEGRTEFTNKEVRLDQRLELPEYRDNFESRLVRRKRRLDERGAPVRIEKAARGRFRLVVSGPLALEAVTR